jgi:hypothetical protein
MQVSGLQRQSRVPEIPRHNSLHDPTACREAVSQSRNIATMAFRGAVGVSPSLPSFPHFERDPHDPQSVPAVSSNPTYG